MSTETRLEPDTNMPAPTPPMQTLRSDMEALGIQVSDLEQQARTLIRERPVVAVLAAAGLGYLFARLARRANR